MQYQPAEYRRRQNYHRGREKRILQDRGGLWSQQIKPIHHEGAQFPSHQEAQHSQ